MTEAAFPDEFQEFQGHHTNQACHKSGIMPLEYRRRELFHTLAISVVIRVVCSNGLQLTGFVMIIMVSTRRQ